MRTKTILIGLSVSILLLVAGRMPALVAQQTLRTLTIHVVGVGNPPATGAVGVIGVGTVCNSGGPTFGNTTCTFPVTNGTALRLTANSPTPSTPGLFSSGTGNAAGCGTSTCAFTITEDSEVTATFDPATPAFTMTIGLGGDGPGEIGADNNRCQNYDHDPSQLPTQFSACTTSYAQGSVVTLEANPPAGSRFSGFANGTNNAGVCSGTPCSFVLNGNTSIAAGFTALTSIAVSPASDTINILQARQFSATGTYGNLTTAPLISGMGTWRSRASMSQPRFSLAAAVAGGRLYAIGGNTTSGPLGIVEAYDPAANSWAARASMSARSGLAAGAIDDQIYAVGGSGPGACPVDTLERYDPAGDTWSTLAPMPGGPRRFLAAAVVGRTLYALGGELNPCGTTSGSPLARVEAYDPDTNQWTARADMLSARRFFGAAVANGIIYVVGGDDTTSSLASVEAYDPATNTWTSKAPLPEARSLLAVTSIDNVIYAIGGNSNGYSSRVFAYDTVSNSWNMKSSLPALIDENPPGFAVNIGAQRAELAAASIGGTLYAVGGLLSQDGTHVPYMTSFVDQLAWSTSDNAVATISNQIGAFFGRATGRQAGTITIRARAAGLTCDLAPGQCATLTVTNTVNNTLPSVTIFGSPQGAPAVTITAGQSISSSGNFRDPDTGQTWTATVDYGDGSGAQPLALGPGNPPQGPTGTFSLSHVYSTAGVFNAVVTVTDSLGGSGTATLKVTVNSSITLGLPNTLSTETGQASWGCGSFRDSNPGGGSWTAVVDYGDNTGTQPLPLTVPGSGPCASFGTPPTGTFAFNHAYASPGSFVVTVTVTNTVTGAARTGSFTVNVEEAEPEGCALVSLNLTPTNVPFSAVQMSLFDRPSGQLLFTEQVPLGTTELGMAPAGSYRATFTVPAGYAVTPAQIDFDVTCGQPLVLTAHVAAVDSTPPTIHSALPNKAMLWPPNHKMVNVAIAVHATDTIDQSPSCAIESVSSNEPVSGTGQGDQSPDWLFSANSLTLQLRAERRGSGSGRIYTIRVRCTDDAGNAASVDTVVLVPHDQGH